MGFINHSSTGGHHLLKAFGQFQGSDPFVDHDFWGENFVYGCEASLGVATWCFKFVQSEAPQFCLLVF